MSRRGIVLGIDGESQGFNGAKVQVGHVGDMTLLLFDPVEIDVVGPVDQIDHRKSHQCAAPSDPSDQETEALRYYASDQVLRRCPQKRSPPHSEDRLAGRETDNP